MTFSKEMKEFDLYMHTLVEKHCEEHDRELTELYNLLECLKSFSSIYPIIESNLIMDEVRTDLLSSIYLATKGMYRNAFISLRSSLELGVGYLYFLDNNLDYIKWTKNKFDLSWSRLNDENYGVLRIEYLMLFHDTASLKESFSSLIAKCNSNYKTCSEYTHGKYGYMKTNLSSKYEYNCEDYTRFIESYKQVVSCLIIIQAIRFNKSLNILSSEYLDEVEVILKSEGLKEILVYE